MDLHQCKKLSSRQFAQIVSLQDKSVPSRLFKCIVIDQIVNHGHQFRLGLAVRKCPYAVNQSADPLFEHIFVRKLSLRERDIHVQ